MFFVQQEDYLKWKGSLFFRFVLTLLDPHPEISAFGKSPFCSFHLCYCVCVCASMHVCARECVCVCVFSPFPGQLYGAAEIPSASCLEQLTARKKQLETSKESQDLPGTLCALHPLLPFLFFVTVYRRSTEVCVVSCTPFVADI